MTPKEKAKELVEKFDNVTNHLYLNNYSDDTAKQCALICADEIMVVCLAINYWKQVKQEIKKL